MNYLKAAFLFPDSPLSGFSNLALHYFYSFFKKNNVDFDIFFHHSEEGYFSKRKIGAFDVVFVSLSYEYYYLNLSEWFFKNKIPMRKSERANGRYPLFVAGGIALTINPAPLIDCFDIILLGEAEKMEKELLHLLSLNSFEEIEDCIANVDFAVSSRKEYGVAVKADSGTFGIASASELMKEGNCFNNRLIMELNRGCTNRCKFCAASYVYKTYREASKEFVFASIDNAVSKNNGLALMGTSLNNVSYFNEILDVALKKSIPISLSSVKVNALTENLVEKLKGCGVKTISFAVESADTNTRKSILKQVTDDNIYNGYSLISSAGMNARFYFIAGLPDTDLNVEADALIELFSNLRKKFGKLSVDLSFAPFSPKPFTPFETERMITKNEYTKFKKNVEKGLKKVDFSIKTHFFSYRESVVQAFLSVSNRGVLSFVEEYGKLANLSETLIKESVSPEKTMTEKRDEMPWRDIILKQ